jgi:hypothetical protein
MVGPDCRIFLDKYDGILEIIRLGIIEAGHNPEEFTAFVERHDTTPACSRSSRSLAGSRAGSRAPAQTGC